jgi:hypothetical protein
MRNRQSQNLLIQPTNTQSTPSITPNPNPIKKPTTLTHPRMDIADKTPTSPSHGWHNNRYDI